MYISTMLIHNCSVPLQDRNKIPSYKTKIMKKKLLILISFVFVLFQMQGQTPSDSCSNPPILQVDTEYSINNLNISQYNFGTPIEGHSSGGNNIRGFWLRVEIPTGYYARNIDIYDVSSNFDPVIGLRSNCSYNYYYNTNNSNRYADDNGDGGDENFGTGLTGPDNGNDGIYHIRIYHYNGSETPTVDFKIKITDDSSSSEADLSVYSIGIDSINPMVGDEIDLETEITNLGEADVTTPVHIRYTIDGVEIGDDDLNGSELPLSQFETEFEKESNHIFTNPGTYQYCVTIDNHEQESNFSNNTSCITITVTDNSCTGVTITQQPTNQTVTSGNSTTFSVSATGTPTITYQWTKNGSNISGATSSIYTTPTLYTSDNGNTYICKVTNCDGTVNSNVATVTVSNSCSAVGISQQPQNQTANVGSTATFSVTANGTSPFTYQWKKNGNNISGETNQIYTTPTLTLSDNSNLYSCFITNCSNSYNITSNSALLTVNSSTTPSEITINNVSTYLSPYLLWHGYTNQSPIPLKICADGSQATEIIFINNTSVSNNNIRFKLSSQSGNGNLYGDFPEPDVYANSVTVKFNHPDYLNNTDANQYYKSDTIIIYDYTDSTVLFTMPIHIYRAPVMMVHGLWGSSNSFSDLDNFLQVTPYNYPEKLTKKVDYKNSFDVSFEENMTVIPNNITRFIIKLRLAKFSSGKVNLICHSMGGILTRKYIQSDYFTTRQNINKLITINTPHSGSPLGNLLFEDSEGSWINIANIAVKKKIDNNARVNRGAVEDLAIGSIAMGHLNDTNLNNNTVHSHTITTKLTDNNKNPILRVYKLMAFYHSLELDPFIYNFFDYDTSDGIVSSKSQKGGLLGNASSEDHLDAAHIGAQNKQLVMESVNELLDKPTNSSSFTYDFNPEEIEPHYRSATSSRVINSSITDGDIIINTPIEDDFFNPGQTVSVNVTSQNEISTIMFTGISNSFEDNQFMESVTNQNFTFNYTIPLSAYDKVTLLAVGFNEQHEIIDYHDISINLNNNSSIDSIEFYENELIIVNNYVSSVGIKATRSNGVVQDITNDPNITYQVSDINIAEHYLGNYIKGNEVGTTTLTATFEGLNISQPIIVYTSDGTEFELPNVLSVIENGIESKENLLKIFPNPNNGNFTIQFNTYLDENINIIIYNNLGEEVLSFKDKSETNLYTKNLSLKGLSNGVYYIKASMGTRHKVGKIIINE
jgi:pimeloyl-ACP methyl ester carboxylesterase